MPEYNFTIGYYPTTPSKKINILTGKRFTRLLVIGFAGTTPRHAMWHCLCDCGNGLTIVSTILTSKQKQSCGCLWKDAHHTNTRTHGMKNTPEYNSYMNAKARCINPKNPAYPDYGQRGVEFRLTSFEEFFAHVGTKPTLKHGIDRIDNEGHYEIGNLKWSTTPEQNRNRRSNRPITAFGQTKLLIEWCEEIHLSHGTIQERLKHNWCNECAVSIPAHKGTCTHR